MDVIAGDGSLTCQLRDCMKPPHRANDYRRPPIAGSGRQELTRLKFVGRHQARFCPQTANLSEVDSAATFGPGSKPVDFLARL
jgi:hypothetical protein